MSAPGAKTLRNPRDTKVTFRRMNELNGKVKRLGVKYPILMLRRLVPFLKWFYFLLRLLYLFVGALHDNVWSFPIVTGRHLLLGTI